MNNQEIQLKLVRFFNNYRIQTYRKGDTIIRGGDSPGGIYYISNGIVRMYAISPRGEEVTLNMFKQHAFFPMSWALNESVNNYFYEAVTETEIRKAPKNDVLMLLTNEPGIVFDLLKRVYMGTDGLIARLTYLMSGTARERLILELIISARRFGEHSLHSNTYLLTISEVELSHLTGLTRETVSREMKVLKEKKLVTYDKHKLNILDIDRLVAELQTII